MRVTSTVRRNSYVPSADTRENLTNQYQIAVIVGSLRKDSFNRKLATGLSKLAPPDLAFRQMQIDDLPLYNQDDDGKQADAVLRLKAGISAAQGVLFVTAEYNRSIPGVLKNAIDHASRPYGKSAWAGKPAGVIGASVGAIGTTVAQQHLRNLLAYLDMPVRRRGRVPRPRHHSATLSEPIPAPAAHAHHGSAIARRKTTNIALIGVSGRVGSRLLTELLARGHAVTGIARSAASVTASLVVKSHRLADAHERLQCRGDLGLARVACRSRPVGFAVPP